MATSERLLLGHRFLATDNPHPALKDKCQRDVYLPQYGGYGHCDQPRAAHYAAEPAAPEAKHPDEQRWDRLAEIAGERVNYGVGVRATIAVDTVARDRILAALDSRARRHAQAVPNHVRPGTARCAGRASRREATVMMLAKISDLTGQLDEAKADKARLDWLDSKMGYEGSFKWLEIGPALREQTLREYLDAARAATTAP